MSGDFNHMDISPHLEGFTQYVNCPTRHNNTLDLCYGNVKDAYNVVAMPPLGKLDHNLIYLRPFYKPCVNRLPPASQSFRRWTPEASEALRDCFQSNDWNVLLDIHGSDTDIDGVLDQVTDYINFCTDVVVTVRTVRCFPNNKPWIMSNIKSLLNIKKLLRLGIGTG